MKEDISLLGTINNINAQLSKNLETIFWKEFLSSFPETEKMELRGSKPSLSYEDLITNLEIHNQNHE